MTQSRKLNSLLTGFSKFVITLVTTKVTRKSVKFHLKFGHHMNNLLHTLLMKYIICSGKRWKMIILKIFNFKFQWFLKSLSHFYAHNLQIICVVLKNYIKSMNIFVFFIARKWMWTWWGLKRYHQHDVVRKLLCFMCVCCKTTVYF